MEPAKRSTENSSRLPLLLGLAVVLTGLVLWDRQPDWGGQGTPGEKANSPIAASGKDGDAAAASGVEAANREGQPVHALSNLDLDKLHDTVGRPLFERKRRPVEPPVARVPVAIPPTLPIPPRAADPNALTLQGILMSESRAIALLMRTQTSQNVRVQEGDTVDGWTIERIEPQRVILRQGDTQIALQLPRKR